MPDKTPLPADLPDEAVSAAIDFTKYRTGDLAQQLTELISVPEAFRRVLKATLLLVALATICCFLIHEYAQITLFSWLGICVYALVLAVAFGVILGVLRVILQALLNLESILRIILETTGRIAMDYEQLQRGKTRLPPAGVLVEQVYQGVVLPVIERAVAKAFGFLEKPVLYTYRRTVGTAVSYLVQRMSRTQTTTDDVTDVARHAAGGLAAIASYSDTIRTYTFTAAELVGRIGARTRCCVMVPTYALFAVSLATASIPILLAVYFASR